MDDETHPGFKKEKKIVPNWILNSTKIAPKSDDCAAWTLNVVLKWIWNYYLFEWVKKIKLDLICITVTTQEKKNTVDIRSTTNWTLNIPQIYKSLDVNSLIVFIQYPFFLCSFLIYVADQGVLFHSTDFYLPWVGTALGLSSPDSFFLDLCLDIFGPAVIVNCSPVSPSTRLFKLIDLVRF